MTLEKFQDNSRNASNFEIKLEDLKKFDIQVILKFSIQIIIFIIKYSNFSTPNSM